MFSLIRIILSKISTRYSRIHVFTHSSMFISMRFGERSQKSNRDSIDPEVHPQDCSLSLVQRQAFVSKVMNCKQTPLSRFEWFEFVWQNPFSLFVSRKRWIIFSYFRDVNEEKRVSLQLHSDLLSNNSSIIASFHSPITVYHEYLPMVYNIQVRQYILIRLDLFCIYTDRSFEFNPNRSFFIDESSN